MVKQRVRGLVFALSLLSIFFLSGLVFSTDTQEEQGFKEELSFSHEQAYFAKKGWQNGLSEMTQSRQRLPWRMGTWEERVNNFISRLKKGDRKAFLYVGYGLLDGYGNPHTHRSARGYPTSVDSTESHGVIWALKKEAKDKNTSIEAVLTEGSDGIRKKVLKAISGGLFNKDPRVRLVAINLLRRLRPDASIAKYVKRAMLLETVTTERAKWREKDFDAPSIENPRLGWRTVAWGGSGSPYPLSDRYTDGSSSGLEDLLNGNGKGIYLSHGLYKKNERNDFPTTITSTDYSTGRQETRQVWTKASLLRYGADDQVSGFETHYSFKEVEVMPRHVYLYIDYRDPVTEIAGESAYYAYHSVWEEMKKLDLFVSRAVWVDKIKNDPKALRIINKDDFRALADQIDGESIQYVPMKSPDFKILGENEVSYIITGMLENRVVSTREECVRFLKRLFERQETSIAARKEIKKALKEARKREIIIDTIRGRHLHSALVVPKQPDDWWGESDEIDTSGWGRDKSKKLELYRNQVEFPEETDIIYHDRRKPGQEEAAAPSEETSMDSATEANNETDAKEVSEAGDSNMESSSVPKTGEEAASAETGEGKEEGIGESKTEDMSSPVMTDAKTEGEEKEVTQEGGGEDASSGDAQKVSESEGSTETKRFEGMGHPLFSYVEDGKISFSVVDKYLNLESFLSGKSSVSAYGSIDYSPGQSPGIQGELDAIEPEKRSVTAQYYEKVRAIETLHSILLGNSEDILRASYIDLQNAFLILLKIQKEHDVKGNVDFLSYLLSGAFSASGKGRRFHSHDNLALELGRGDRARSNLQTLIESIRGNVYQFALKKGNLPGEESSFQQIRREIYSIEEGDVANEEGSVQNETDGNSGYSNLSDNQLALSQSENDNSKLKSGFYQVPPQWKLYRDRLVKGFIESLSSKDPQKRLLIVHILRRLIPDSSMLTKVNRLLRELETVDKYPYMFFDTFVDYITGDPKLRVQEKIVGHELLKLQRFVVRRVLVNKIRSGIEPDLLKEIPKGSFLSLVVRIDAEWDPYRIPFRTPVPRSDSGQHGMFFSKKDIDVIKSGLENRNFLVQREVARWLISFYNYNRAVTKHLGHPDSDGIARKFIKAIKDAEKRGIIYYERNYVQWKYKNQSFDKTQYVGDPDNKIVRKEGVSGIPVGRVPVRISSVADADIFRKIDQDRRKEFIDLYGLDSVQDGVNYDSFVEKEKATNDGIKGEIGDSYKIIRESRDKEKERLGDKSRDDNEGLDYSGN